MNNLNIANFPILEYASNEAFNMLATNIFYCGADIKTILVTSRYVSEGKSFVTMNLMRTLASLNKRVVLLDTDLRRSNIIGRYRIRFDTTTPYGLAQYLAGMCEIDDILYATNIENAYMVPIGREVNSSLQLLSSGRMESLMAQLRSYFDIVLVDSPPAGIIVDAVEIAKYCDGALIVVSYNRGKKQEIADVREAIEKTGCQVMGAVLNNVDFGSYSNRKYYYKSERYASYYNGKYYSSTKSGAKNPVKSQNHAKGHR